HRAPPSASATPKIVSSASTETRWSRSRPAPPAARGTSMMRAGAANAVFDVVRVDRSELLRRERVAGADRAFLQPGLEPPLTLLRRSVREGIRHHVAAGLLLQTVVADRGCRAQRRIDVARLQQLPALLGLVRPDAGETIGLQLDAHLDAIGLRLVDALLELMRLRQDTELVLHMMADLVRDDVGLHELAGAAAGIAAMEARLDLAEERGIEIDLLVVRAIERTHGALGIAAGGRRRAAVEDESRRAIAL